MLTFYCVITYYYSLMRLEGWRRYSGVLRSCSRRFDRRCPGVHEGHRWCSSVLEGGGRCCDVTESGCLGVLYDVLTSLKATADTISFLMFVEGSHRCSDVLDGGRRYPGILKSCHWHSGIFDSGHRCLGVLESGRRCFGVLEAGRGLLRWRSWRRSQVPQGPWQRPHMTRCSWQWLKMALLPSKVWEMSRRPSTQPLTAEASLNTAAEALASVKLCCSWF